MKIKRSVAVIVVGMVLLNAFPVFAAKDLDATTTAYIGDSLNSDKYVVGKAYARSINSKFKSINVSGSLYLGSTVKESGTASTSTKGNEAAWPTKDNTYSSSNSYTLKAASRTYYTDGTSSDQAYAEATN